MRRCIWVTFGREVDPASCFDEMLKRTQTRMDSLIPRKHIFSTTERKRIFNTFIMSMTRLTMSLQRAHPVVWSRIRSWAEAWVMLMRRALPIELMMVETENGG